MKKILYNLLILLLVFALFSCGELNPAAGKPSTPDDEQPEVPVTPPDPNKGYEFSVSFILGGEKYVPTEKVSVQWTGQGAVHRAETDESGVAKIKGLDGNYSVTLVNTPRGLIYNPNVYVATNSHRDLTVELFEIVYPTGTSKGTNYYNDVINLTRTGHYRLTLTSSDPTYFQFVPKSTGAYVIESWVDITGNNINPIAHHHDGTSVWKNPVPDVYDTGGSSSTYTKNFRLKINVAPSNLSETGGVILCFGIFATLRDGEITKDNPVTVDFSVEYRGSADDIGTDKNFMIPEELPLTDSAREQWNNKLDTWHERYSNGGALHEAGALGVRNGNTIILNDTSVEYNEDSGFYHVYNLEKYPQTDGFGPILYAHITSNTIFLDSSLSFVEYAGNNALTVSRGTENYKLFIEGYEALIVNPNANNPQATGPYFCTNTCPCRGDKYYPSGTCEGSCPESCSQCDEDCRHLPREYEHREGYAQFANSDGLCPVTKELKEFLQKFAVAQMLFKDGYGHAETVINPPFTAYEGSQWLFACAYYE